MCGGKLIKACAKLKPRRFRPGTSVTSFYIRPSSRQLARSNGSKPRVYHVPVPPLHGECWSDWTAPFANWRMAGRVLTRPILHSLHSTTASPRSIITHLSEKGQLLGRVKITRKQEQPRIPQYNRCLFPNNPDLTTRDDVSIPFATLR